MAESPTSKPTAAILRWLQGVAVGGLLWLSVSAPPHPASRIGTNKWGGKYFAKGHQEFINACQKGFSAARHVNGWSGSPLEGPLGVALDFRIAKSRSSRLTAPRGDVDNYAKVPLDVATRLQLWIDDTQVTALAVQKRWCQASEEPGVTMWVAAVA